MRVASKTVYDMVTHNLGNVTEELNSANEVVATSKRINSLSDDPVGLTQVLNLKASLANIDQMDRNINMGKTWLAAAESALTQVSDLISATKALCIEMATATKGAPERAAAAATIQNAFDEIVTLANSEINGQYIFSGSRTDTAAFSQGGVYSGDNRAFTVRIGRDASAEVGFDGEAVFQPSGAGAADDIFQTLSDLKTALENNNVSGIQEAATRLDSHNDNVSSTISDIGSRAIRVEIKKRMFQDLKSTNTERLSMLEDADITEAIMNLKAKEVAYQAALASAARVLAVSLVNYLR